MRFLLALILLVFTPSIVFAEAFSKPKRVKIMGYDKNAMEPFLSRDGKFMFFNNLNDKSVNTDIHLALKKDAYTFQYAGRVKNINTDALEGVPSLDVHGKMYFVSPRAYKEFKSTLYVSDFKNGEVSNVRPLKGDYARYKPPWFNMDIEITADGRQAYIVENKKAFFSPWPAVSNFILAVNAADGMFNKHPRSDEILQNINTDDALEYAAGITHDNLTLYFTRFYPDKKRFGIYVTTRAAQNDVFPPPTRIESINGFVEGPTMTPDNCALYFHKKDGELFHLYRSEKLSCAAR